MCGRTTAGCNTHDETHGLDRRDFVTRSLLTAVASFLATNSLIACGNGIIGADGLTAPPTLGNGTTITLSNYPALANVGGIASIGQVGGTPIAVARTATNTFVALSMICTHQGTTLDIVSGGFHCPNHGATFATDGHWTGGQQTTNLVSYPVTYDSTAGTLQIGGGTSAAVSSISLQPTSVTIATTQSTQLTATLLDSTHTVVTGRTVTWTSSNTSVATVDDTGLVKGIAAGGPVTITAAVGTISATASITVTAGTATGGLVVNPSQFPALANVGGIARVDNNQAGTLPVAVVRTGTSTWVAFSMVCPHQGTTINIVSSGFLCPNHGAQFSSAGANTGGQQTSSLTSLPVTVQTDGTLLISGTAGSGGSGGGGDDD